uniref:Transcriptional regulator n=1 Tax=Steinernema glaseri TaxID=37863 RepID=A0A1I7YDF3_9BILA
MNSVRVTALSLSSPTAIKADRSLFFVPLECLERTLANRPHVIDHSSVFIALGFSSTVRSLAVRQAVTVLMEMT